jgi:spermidine synthase
MPDSEPQLIVNQHSADGSVRVWQQDDRRWLDFDDGLIQSEINLRDASRLALPLNRAMLAGLMFEDTPQRILLVGTGGGATARYFEQRFPQMKGEAVELSEVVASLALKYFEFPQSAHWQLIQQDIRDYVQACKVKYDLILVDIAEQQLTPEWIIRAEFLGQCRQLLTPKGQLSLNLLVTDGNSFMHYLSALRRQFDKRTVCLSLPNYRNTVILAFNNLPSKLYIKPQQRKRLEQLWGIEFELFYQQMLKDNPRGSGIF